MSLNNNQIKSIYRRLLYKEKVAPINVLTTRSNCLYDSVLSGLNDKYITFLSSNFANSIVDSTIIFINDPGLFLSQSNKFNLFTNKILFFHDDKITKMKKEDLFLFNNQIKNYECYTFDKKVSFINKNIIPIDYGFIPLVKEYNRSKSIILLGDEQNIDIIMHNHIKQKYADADLVHVRDLINKDVSSILSQYRICITMNSKYNSLLAAANGCFIISNIDHKESDIPYSIHAHDFDTVMNNIDNLLSKNISIHKDISRSVVQKYDYSRFSTTISTIIQNTCNRIIKL